MKTLTEPNRIVLRDVVNAINNHSKFSSKRKFFKIIENIKFPECKGSSSLEYDNRNYIPIGHWLAQHGYIAVVKNPAKGPTAGHEVLILHRVTDPESLSLTYNPTSKF